MAITVKNEILHSDCLEYIKTIDDKCVDLAIVDPPYNVGAASWDKVNNYLPWLQSVLLAVQRTLKDNASLYLWGSTRNNDFLRTKLWLDEQLQFRNWIVWLHQAKIHRKVPRYLCKHEDLLYYAGENAKFNVVRDPPTETQLKIHAGKYTDSYFVPADKLPPSQQKIFKTGLQLGSPAKSWWLGPSNQSNGKKYKKFPGYKSEWVCERMITVSSDPNDLVLVPFAGIGTECLSAHKLGRQYLACEIDEERCKLAKERLRG